MRALSIRQPWASLIALGLKPDETRTFSVSYRGPIAIAAGATYGRRERAARDRILEAFPCVPWREVYGDQGDPPLGAIVAVAELVHVEVMHPSTIAAASPLARAVGEWSPGNYAWRLAAVRRLRDPLPFKGALGLIKLSDEVAAEVERRAA